jgi:hypothetical protein
VYFFRKSEVNNIIHILNRTLQLLPRRINILWHELIDRVYGAEYDPGRTFNDYAKMHDGILYKNQSVLFDKTQEQINRLKNSEIVEIEQKIRKVKEKLENLINDSASDRFFGPMDDPYIWLYEDELP